MNDCDYLDRAAACMLAAQQVQDPAERQALVHIAQAYLKLFERNGGQDPVADKLWPAMAQSQARQISN